MDAGAIGTAVGVVVVGLFIVALIAGLLSRSRGAGAPRLLENSAQRLLGFGGLGLLIIGLAMLIAGNMAATNARNGNELLVLMGGIEFQDSTAGAAGDAWAVAGIVVTCIAVATLLTLVAVKAIPRRELANAGDPS